MNPHCPTICAMKRVPSSPSFALFRLFAIRFFEAPSLQSIAHCALSPHTARRFPSQVSEKRLQPPAPFSRRAIAKRAPAPAHTATAKKAYISLPSPHGQRLKSPLPQHIIEAIPSAPASIPPALYNVC